MTGMPEPVPLDPPLEDIGALEDVVEGVAGAAYWLTVLGGELSGPAASAPGWLGGDAAAAAAQVGAVAGIARECAAGVGVAAHRLRLHSELLRDVRRAVAALRSAQDDDFTAARQRLNAMGDVGPVAMTDAPERLAILERLRTSEAARRSRHAALLEELAHDVATTAAVLADASALVGGQGSRGDGERVLAHLAAELPGWGERELAARGEALAEALREAFPVSEQEELARRVLALAGSPAFAEALLRTWRCDGVREALRDLGDGVLARDGAVAQMVAMVFGSALSGGEPGHLLERVLSALYVDAAETDRDRDLVMYGMAAVLGASTALRSGGLQRRTVLGWSRQILAREHALLDGVGQREYPWAGFAVDPLPAVLGALEDLGSPSAAAEVLSEPATWSLLLGRPWADGGSALSGVVALAGADSGPDGERATRLALEGLGSGLADGDPEGWTVDRGTATAVSPALASAVVQHVTVVAGVLCLGLDGELRGRAGDLLRGLGYLTLDDGAARTVRTALADWVRTQPVPAELTCDPVPWPLVVVPSAFLAVREYGQRLAHALHGFEQQAEAQHDERIWNWTAGLLANSPRRTAAAAAATIVTGYAAMATDNDGWWENGLDDGPRFDRDDAAAAALRLTPAADDGVRRAVAGSARAVFDRTGEALGEPRPPVPEERDRLGPLKDAAVGTAEHKALTFVERRVGKVLDRDLERELDLLRWVIHPFR
jgi:hypothetical protein